MQPASSFPAFTGLPCNSSDQGHQDMTVVPGAGWSLSSLAPARARLGSLAAFAILTILFADSLTFICSYFWALYFSALESITSLLHIYLRHNATLCAQKPSGACIHLLWHRGTDRKGGSSTSTTHEQCAVQWCRVPRESKWRPSHRAGRNQFLPFLSVRQLLKHGPAELVSYIFW
jgi:hypothetical protein